jgi:hypothetical protein
MAAAGRGRVLMINTPLEAYDQLKHGDLVVDADGELFRVCAGTVMDLMRFGDDVTVAIDSDGAMSITPWMVKFPLRKVVVIAAEASAFVRRGDR